MDAAAIADMRLREVPRGWSDVEMVVIMLAGTVIDLAMLWGLFA